MTDTPISERERVAAIVYLKLDGSPVGWKAYKHTELSGGTSSLVRKAFEAADAIIAGRPPEDTSSVVGWRDISTAPRDGTHITVLDADGVTTAHWCTCQENWTEIPPNNDERTEFTHWMPPIPAPTTTSPPGQDNPLVRALEEIAGPGDANLSYRELYNGCQEAAREALAQHRKEQP